MIKNLFFGIAAFLLPFIDIISIRYSCFHNEMGPELYGFPFIYRTQIPWVNSFEGNLYLLGYLGNALFYLLIIKLIELSLNKINENIIRNKYFKISTIIVFILTIVFSSLPVFIYEWECELTTKKILEYADQPLNCEKQWIFFGNKK